MTSYDRRISNYNPKLANSNKRNAFSAPFVMYKSELQLLVTDLLNQTDIPSFLEKEKTSALPFPARLSQVLGKQASAIARSAKNKLQKATALGHNERMTYQQEIIDAWNSGNFKIDINSVNIELDSRFIDIQPAIDTSICDFWIKITSFPKGSFLVPLKLTNHMKDLISRGYELKTNSLRVNSDNTLGFYFVKAKRKPNIPSNPNILGIDIGRNKAIAASNGRSETTHATGHMAKVLLDMLARKQQNSQAFKKIQRALKNQINYSLKNDISWDTTQILAIEHLKDMKRYNKWGQRNHFWPLGHVQNKLSELCEEHNVWITRVNPAYTSQTCSKCGHKDKKNRNSEKFLRLACGVEMDADINAAINIRERGANSPSVKKYQDISSYDCL